MKNDECTIYIMLKDKWIQKFRKEEDGWKEYSRNCTVRSCAAGQLISHILPPLQLIEAGFEFVCDFGANKVFRKRK